MNDIVRVDLQQLATEYGYTKSQLDLVRLVAAKDCTDEEVAQLLALAYVTGLNPLQKQLYMVRRFDSQSGKWQATPQTGIDGFRSVADNTERYAPGQESTFKYGDNGELISATAYIKKMAGGVWHEVPATALYKEYVQLKKDGKPNTFWARMPHVMLEKCAESKALRRAFPNKLSGIYTHDEMAQATVAEDEPTVIVENPVASKTQQGLSVVENVPETPYAPNEPPSDSRLEKWANIEALGKQLFGDEWVEQRNQMVKAIARSARNWKDLGLEQMDKIWQELKKIQEQSPTPDMA